MWRGNGGRRSDRPKQQKIRGLLAAVSNPANQLAGSAEAISTAVGLPVQVDVRLRERMNWDGVACSFDEFLAEWDRSTRDRDYVPSCGDSSHIAAARLLSFLDEHRDEGIVVAVTHGGVTIDLLRTLLGDELEIVSPGLLKDGVPSCAITRLAHDGSTWSPAEIANSEHLRN